MSDEGLVSLRNDTFTAVISLDGAWLEFLEFNGQSVLFPKTEYELPDGSKKIRGGSHVCLPNFGPGGDSGLAQHGFGRETQWLVKEQNEASVTLALKGGSNEYAAMFSELTYALEPNSVVMRLVATNTGTVPLRVSPGFHPYFAVAEQASVQVDGDTYQVGALSEMVSLFTEPKTLTIGNSMYSLQAEDLPQWVLWSDRLGDYVCLEPTEAGFSFLNDVSEQELLLGGQQKSWVFSIRVGI